MDEAQVERRLAAILVADIAGYSRLMAEDKAATVATLKGHQAVILPMVDAHGGRIQDTAGDGILAEFRSVQQAVECAIAIQRTMAERNAAVPPTHQMCFRIGLNHGDVMSEVLDLQVLCDAG
jgi:adenylate cyclase